MQIKLLNDIITNIVGKQASELVSILYGKKNLNEFIIAKKLKLTINQTRNLLYKLSDVNLVSFTRKKDKKKGWYTYFWTLNIEKSLELLESNIHGEIESLKSQMRSREYKRYYICNTCKVELSEETALLHNFTCSECGSVYELQTDKKIILDLGLKIKRLELTLNSINEELEKVRVKSEKGKLRSQKRQDKKDKTERKERRDKKKAEKKKLEKKPKSEKSLPKGKKKRI